jgi:glucose/arabinose dehydrogenase
MRIANLLTLAAIALAIAGCSRQADKQAPAAGNQVAARPDQPQLNVSIDTPALVNACLSAEDARRPLASFTAEQKHAFVACANREAARQVNPQLPKRVDDLTTLTSITPEDATVVYNYTVDIDAGQINPAALRQLEQATRANVCRQMNMVQTMAMGGSYAYVWNDRAGRPIHRMRIDAC